MQAIPMGDEYYHRCPGLLLSGGLQVWEGV
jgi:hypothetical protein